MSVQTRPMDQLEKLQFLRQQTRNSLEQCQNDIAGRIREITSTTPSTSANRLVSFAQRGMAIYRAVQIGFRIGDVVSGLFGRRKHRRW